MTNDEKNSGSLLLVDDDRHLLESMSDWLRSIGYTVETANGYDVAVAHINRRKFDLVLCDVRLQGRDGFDVLAYCKNHRPEMTVILITGYGTVETGVEALRAGAFELLTKPLIDEELDMAIQRALSQRQVVEENKQLRAKLDNRFGSENIIGSDHRMQRIFEVIQSVADTRATVLVTGESGTGKSMIARAIHRESNRANGPFVEVACGALPEMLLESELFGHVKGAFTGATSDKIGKFKQADGGTLFLDEIATAPLSMQVKLLRVLQDLEFEQVGGTKTFRVDTRVVCATNTNLQQAVIDGVFRQDLLFRINVINLEVPPLRERVSDIPQLARYFLQKSCADASKVVHDFSPGAMEVLQRHRWPGNVRELQNVIERSVLLGRGEILDEQDLPGDLVSGSPAAMPRAAGKTLKEALEAPERAIILEVLEAHDWNRNLTADILGINRTTLYKKMKRLGLDDEKKSTSRPKQNLSPIPAATAVGMAGNPAPGPGLPYSSA